MFGEITLNMCHRRDRATGSGEEWDESERSHVAGGFAES